MLLIFNRGLGCPSGSYATARLWRGVLDTTCNKVCQWLASGRWFSPGTRLFYTNKTAPI